MKPPISTLILSRNFLDSIFLYFCSPCKMDCFLWSSFAECHAFAYRKIPNKNVFLENKICLFVCLFQK